MCELGKSSFKAVENLHVWCTTAILQDTCRDQLHAPVGFELLHFSHVPNQDQLEKNMQTYADTVLETNKYAFHPSVYTVEPYLVVQWMPFLKCKHSIKTKFFSLL